MHKLIHLITLLTLVACGAPEAPSGPVAERVEGHDVADAAAQAAAIAKAVRAEPGNAEAILAEHNLTSDAFEALLYEVAADPELSKAYLAALE